ncbi:MAG: 30S ribosomal protein S4 [Clostridiales bacterium]|nr:30S ribosomal protein S4 [Clostridiales bacterium]
MARYTGASCRRCRRAGEKLFLKGEKCYKEKCPVARRAYAPGQHGQQKKNLKEYGLQLREKQKAKRFYGILERQFRKYFEIAFKKQGVTGENLLTLLETRLDNVVYRMGLADSRAQARQFVRHNHITVNGKKVNIPSYLVKVGDIIALKEKSRSISVIKEIVESNSVKAPRWLEVDAANFSCKVIALPEREDVDLQVQEHLIVELYSK